jgi:polar amino acid transport system substrate-binding protein
MTFTRRFAGIALASAAALALAVPASAQSTQQSLSSGSVIESIKQEGVIKIGLSIFLGPCVTSTANSLVSSST